MADYASRLSALWDSIMAKKPLRQVSGQEPPPQQPANQDTSAVRKAAEDAGRRMQAIKDAEEKKRLAAQATQ